MCHCRYVKFLQSYVFRRQLVIIIRCRGGEGDLGPAFFNTKNIYVSALLAHRGKSIFSFPEANPKTTRLSAMPFKIFVSTCFDPTLPYVLCSALHQVYELQQQFGGAEFVTASRLFVKEGELAKVLLHITKYF